MWLAGAKGYNLSAKCIHYVDKTSIRTILPTMQDGFLTMRLPRSILEQLETIGPNHLRGSKGNTKRVLWALEQFIKTRRNSVMRETASSETGSRQ